MEKLTPGKGQRIPGLGSSQFPDPFSGTALLCYLWAWNSQSCRGSCLSENLEVENLQNVREEAGTRSLRIE